MSIYKEKYLKYKTKYLELKGGGVQTDIIPLVNPADNRKAASFSEPYNIVEVPAPISLNKGYYIIVIDDIHFSARDVLAINEDHHPHQVLGVKYKDLDNAYGNELSTFNENSRYKLIEKNVELPSGFLNKKNNFAYYNLETNETNFKPEWKATMAEKPILKKEWTAMMAEKPILTDKTDKTTIIQENANKDNMKFLADHIYMNEHRQYLEPNDNDFIMVPYDRTYMFMIVNINNMFKSDIALFTITYFTNCEQSKARYNTHAYYRKTPTSNAKCQIWVRPNGTRI
jgi:hypothetical protein